MTPSVEQLLRDCQLVLFEFEGVVCNTPGQRFDVAKTLSRLARRFSLPITLIDSRDTFELLSQLDSKATEVAEAGDQAVAELELELINDAMTNPGVRSLLELVRQSNRKTACISRMSSAAVHRFIEENDLIDQFDLIVTRPRALSHMMPEPHVFHTVRFNLQTPLENSLLVASSTASCDAAKEVRVPTIVYRKSHYKRTHNEGSLPEVRSLVELGSVLGEVYLDARERQLQRVFDLRDKGSLTDAEMLEYLVISGGGKNVGDSANLGFLDQEAARENLWILEHSRREAAGRGLILEVYASTAILIEMEIRQWFSACKARTFRADEKFTLGKLVNQASDAGLDADISVRLSRFVESRNIGIHRIIQGERKYFDLGAEYMKDPSLYEDLVIWVSSQLPEAVNQRAGTWNAVNGEQD
ncbi:HAD hydrolase-like protein [Amycolatopsis sp. NPDC005961]|uniref:HAD family hydrolase n=1 Tax=Amycolatopsis sp. NPDC005961 TaxID=3156720 RepID=UPI0033E626F0